MRKFKKQKPNGGPNPPWEDWSLDKHFFERLSRYDQEHPTTTLDKIMDRVREGLEKHKPLIELVPDNPFPARSLVTAMAHLLQLGIMVARAQDSVNTFANQIVTWVQEVKTTFISVNGGRFTWATWKQLNKMRDLVDEICVWAAARLQDRRWSRFIHGISVEDEIKEFNTRLAQARDLFMDLSVINLSGGIDAILATVRLLMHRQDIISKEILKIKQKQSEQLTQIIDELNAQKRREERRRFLEQNLNPSTVTNPTYIEQGKYPCDKETRIEVLAEIMEWIRDTSHTSQNFLWLSGDPGCGKSAITASIARACKDEKTLWAQFFINRNNEQTTNPNSYFPTIARQFAEHSNEVENAVYDALKAQPSLMDSISAEQAAKLFVDAIAVACKLDLKAPVVIVIDGLDETDRGRLKDTAVIFSHLFEELAKYPNAKIFISSRTEHEIRNPFAQQMKVKHVKHVHLDTSAQSSIDDVSGFLRRQLMYIVVDNDLEWEAWPGEERMTLLAKRASGLFIWAVTVTKYLREEISVQGTECLDRILDLLTGDALGDINTLYRIILQLSYKSRADPWDYEKFRMIVGAIVGMREPLCLEDLGKLLDLRQTPTSPPVDIIRFVQRLRTVLVAGTDAVTPRTVPRLHKSFYEFITNFDDANFHVDPQVIETVLSQCCIKHLSSSYAAFASTPLPGSFRYAARYAWAHIRQATGQESATLIKGHMRSFGSLHDTLRMISGVEDWSPSNIVLSSDHSEISRLLHDHKYTWSMQDGHHITTTFEGYESAVISVTLSPNGQTLLSAAENDLNVTIWELGSNGCYKTVLPTTHEEGITCLSFSPQGTRFATGSNDCSICIWDLATRTLITSITESATAPVTCMTFSPNDHALLFGSEDGTIRLWDMDNLVQISPSFSSHQHPVLSIAFTKDGQHVISTSADGTLLAWCPFSRHEGDEPAGCTLAHENEILAVAFCPETSGLAVAGTDGITIYDTLAQPFVDNRQIFLGSTFGVLSALAYSPTGDELVLGYEDGRITVMDLTGEIRHTFTSHGGRINSLTFASDGASVVSGCADMTVRQWTLHHMDPTPGEQSHNGLVAQQLKQYEGDQKASWVALSPCGQLVVYGLQNGSTHLWDARKSPSVCHTLSTRAIQLKKLAFSPNLAFIAGAAKDGRICLWEVDSGKLVATSCSDHISEVEGISFTTGGEDHLSITYSDDSIHYWKRAGSRMVGADLADPKKLESVDPTMSPTDFGDFSLFPDNLVGRPIWVYLSGHIICLRANGSITSIQFEGERNSRKRGRRRRPGVVFDLPQE